MDMTRDTKLVSYIVVTIAHVYVTLVSNIVHVHVDRDRGGWGGGGGR